jgi:Fic family protein
MAAYIYQYPEFPRFTWDRAAVLPELAKAAGDQGRLLGKLEALGFITRHEARSPRIRRAVFCRI